MNDKSPMAPIIIEGRCIGHLFMRGKQGVEAFDADTKSLGLFADQHTAAAVISTIRGDRPLKSLEKE